MFFFFFSSRRRHTRSLRDWSSDVCSSDLRLRQKGLIQRQRKGNAFVYHSRVAREEVERARARNAVTRLLGATPRAAVAALVEAVDAVDPALLEELERAVVARRRTKDGA